MSYKIIKCLLIFGSKGKKKKPGINRNVVCKKIEISYIININKQPNLGHTTEDKSEN